jgi:hypothetical protein
VLLLQAAADEEPLALSGVTISPAAEEELTQAWQAVAQHSLYSSPQQLLDLVQQVRVFVCVCPFAAAGHRETGKEGVAHSREACSCCHAFVHRVTAV